MSTTPREVNTIWTIPNLFTLLRLLCLPIFVWLLVRGERQAAGWMLGALSATDWVDGYLARRLGQVSEFGKAFDPTVDRLVFFVALIAIIVDGSIPLWFGLAVLFREVAVGASVAIATVFFHMKRFDVTLVGKWATFLLMLAVPGFLLSHSSIVIADWFGVASWIIGIPGLILSYYAGLTYIPRIKQNVQHRSLPTG
ncbi:MAG: hypothetical protein CSA55_05420 [Ilumatobacter coccineus]|uniref:CDP-diacylglycerol--glycerol-3-phosphate 3-phosphatidyltransferase n=1 Tax=Ilumatobacter coccineus TaxID=467094 RepID=A0A2G6K7E6_9ACTN|nr:MAG: hypothetical protein CSA55_05420 [Ilumatobacter coccineus]